MSNSIIDLFNQMLVAVTLVTGPTTYIDPESYNSELVCMAVNIYHEAGNQTQDGKNAVAHVTLNRVEHNKYPDTICDVVYDAHYYINWKGNRMPRRWQCQYTWFCDGESDKILLRRKNGESIKQNAKAWQDSVIAAFYAMNNISEDPTNGATHYWNPSLANPNWGYPVTAIIGSHVFATRIN